MVKVFIYVNSIGCPIAADIPGKTKKLLLAPFRHLKELFSGTICVTTSL